MSRTTTEVYSGSWRQHFLLETDDGQYVPLIASDPRADPTRAQVFKLDSAWKAKGRSLKVELNDSIPLSSPLRPSVSTSPSARPYAPQDTLTPTKMASTYGDIGSDLLCRDPLALDVAAIMKSQFPEHAAPYSRTLTEADRKEYCTYWIRHGECDYMQQGCRYKHEMPDLMTLRAIGFRHVPEWYRVRMSRRPLRTLPDLLQCVLNRNANDSASETDSDDSDATLPETTRRQAVAPSTTPVQKASVPAPSTIDLLSFIDEEDQPQLPKVPNNTPETSSYALSNLSPNRQGRFIPAGEKFPRMSTPLLQPSPAFPIVERREEPIITTKAVYAPPARIVPVFNEYFKEQKAAKSQEKLWLSKKEEEEAAKSTATDLDSDKCAQIAELQAKLAELAATTRTPPTALGATIVATTAQTPVLASTQGIATPAPTSVKNGLMASKHSEVRAKGRSKSKARDGQKLFEGAAGKGRRLPAGRARKVASPKPSAEMDKVVAKK